MRRESYQTQEVRANLAEVAFGSLAGQNNGLLISIRSLSIQSDPGAPIEPSQDDLSSFERRSDVKDARRRLKRARRARDRKRINKYDNKLRHLNRKLRKLAVLERREEYFKRVDDLRSRGLPTTVNDPRDASSSGRGDPWTRLFAQFLETCDKNPVVEGHDV